MSSLNLKYGALRALPFIILLGAMGVGSLWLAPSTRLLGLSLGSKTQPSTLRGGLLDSDDSVAAAACAYLLQLGGTQDLLTIAEALQDRPAAALRCLKHQYGEFEKEADGEASSAERAQRDVALYQLLAAQFGHGWAAELMHRGEGGEQVDCQMTENIRQALIYSRDEPEHTLLQCAVAADSAQARQCCAQQLGEDEGMAEVLGRPEDFPMTSAGPNFSRFVQAAFFEATTDPAVDAAIDAEKTTTPIETTFGETPDLVQDWVVQIGCRLQQNRSTELSVIEAFVPLIEAKSCAPEHVDAQKAAFYEVGTWRAACQEVYPARRAAREPASQALCRSLDRASRGQVARHAHAELSRALVAAHRAPGVSPPSPIDHVSQMGRDARSRSTRRPRRFSRATSQSSRMFGAFFHGMTGGY